MLWGEISHCLSFLSKLAWSVMRWLRDNEAYLNDGDVELEAKCSQRLLIYVLPSRKFIFIHIFSFTFPLIYSLGEETNERNQHYRCNAVFFNNPIILCSLPINVSSPAVFLVCCIFPSLFCFPQFWEMKPTSVFCPQYLIYVITQNFMFWVRIFSYVCVRGSLCLLLKGITDETFYVSCNCLW